MNAEFKLGEIQVGTETGDLFFKEVELITLSGDFMGKDEITRPATDMDRFVYKEAYAAFKTPPSPPASAGASKDADATDAGAAGADDTKPPSAG